MWLRRIALAAGAAISTALTVWADFPPDVAQFGVGSSPMTGVRDAGGAAEGLLSYIQPHHGYPARRHAGQLEQSYSELIWVRAVTGRIADGYAGVQWHLHRATGNRARRQSVVNEVNKYWGEDRHQAIGDLTSDGELIEIPRHPMLDVIRRGTPQLIGFDKRRLTSILLDTVGECFWILDEDLPGVPNRAWVVPSSWCYETPTPSSPYYRFRRLSWDAIVPEANVLWHRDPDPANPYDRGVGMVGSAADEFAADELAGRYLAQWFFRGGRPPVVISGAGVKDNKAAHAVADAEWREKALKNLPKWFPRKVDVHELTGHKFAEQELVKLREFYRNVVLQAWGYPPELLGIKHSNREAYTLAQEFHARHNLVPRLDRLQETLAECLQPRYRGLVRNAVLGYQNPVPADRDFALKALRAQPHAAKQRDWRRLIGLKPVEGDEVHLVSNRFRAYERLDEVELLKPGQTAAGESAAAEATLLQELLDQLRELLEGKEEGSA